MYYEHNLDRKRIYEKDIDESKLIHGVFPLTGEKVTYHKKSIEDGMRIMKWYMKHGFVPTMSILNDWMLSKIKGITMPCMNVNGDSFLIKYCDKHQSLLDKEYVFPHLNSGKFSLDETYESTSKYMTYLLKHRQTDLPFRDWVYTQ